MSSNTDKQRILIAEDDDEIATLLVRLLGDDYEVSRAHDGHEALILAASTRPDLLLFDIMMPGIDGLQASRFAREFEGLERVPIIFLTAKDQPYDIIRGIQHNARHYITKPFKLSDVRAKVDKILNH